VSGILTMAHFNHIFPCVSGINPSVMGGVHGTSQPNANHVPCAGQVRASFPSDVVPSLSWSVFLTIRQRSDWV